MTYVELGKNRKNPYRYDISKFKNRVRSDDQARKDLILKIIKEFSDIRHTHVLTLAYEISHMPKVTAERTLKRLKRDQKIDFTKHGEKSNSPKTWRLKPPIVMDVKSIEIIASVNQKFMDTTFTFLKENYNKFTKDEKKEILIKIENSFYNSLKLLHFLSAQHNNPLLESYVSRHEQTIQDTWNLLSRPKEKSNWFLILGPILEDTQESRFNIEDYVENKIKQMKK